MLVYLFLAVLSLGQFFGGHVNHVYAQTVSPTPQATPTAADESQASNSSSLETLAPTDSSTDPAMTALTNTYHGQLSDYRDAEHMYQVNVGQYTQLQTLVSLESAVQATHKAQVARDQVLITYLMILKMSLDQGTGIDLNQKSRAQTDLDNAISAVQSHAVTSGQATSRDDVNKVAVSFSALEGQIQSAAYEAQTLLAIGKLQTVYDKAISLTDEIDTTLVQQNNDVKQPQRQRAIAEIRQTLASAKDAINTVIDHRVNGNDITFSQSTYEGSLGDLNQIYAQLSQSLSFLDEILRL